MGEPQEIVIGNCFEVAKKLALEAGELFKSAMSLEREEIEIKTSRYGLSTEYDVKIEKMLISGLSAHFPDHKFITEESLVGGSTDDVPELTDSPTWFIDPIDGTTNFIHNFPQCCISIGLTVLKKLQLGIVYNPVKNEMYTALKGHGAFLNEERIETSKAASLKKSLIDIEVIDAAATIRRGGGGVATAAVHRDIAYGRIEAFVSSCEGVRNIGSAALALAYVANGSLDAFHFDNLAPWTVAAGSLLVEEAGGIIIDTKGGPHDITRPRTIAAACGLLAKEISKLIVDTDLRTQRRRLKRVPSSLKLL